MSTLSAAPLKTRMIQVRRDLGVSWRHLPIRLGLDRQALHVLRFGQNLETSSALHIARRIGAVPAVLWPELARTPLAS